VSLYARGVSDDFPARVSSACHDLRTPLASAFGFARTLERLGALEGEQARYLSLVVESTAELGRLIDCLALVARVEGDRLVLDARPVESRELVAEAVALAPADRVEGVGEGRAIDVDRLRAASALAWLSEAVVRLVPGEGTARLEARPDGSFAVGPVSDVMGDRLAVGEGDLRALAALVVARAHRGSICREDDRLVVRFAAT
jgi:hypothetical protein